VKSIEQVVREMNTSRLTTSDQLFEKKEDEKESLIFVFSPLAPFTFFMSPFPSIALPVHGS
jgi:hypothetical protein